MMPSGCWAITSSMILSWPDTSLSARDPARDVHVEFLGATFIPDFTTSQNSMFTSMVLSTATTWMGFAWGSPGEQQNDQAAGKEHPRRIVGMTRKRIASLLFHLFGRRSRTYTVVPLSSALSKSSPYSLPK
jgi:hypothetical protein